MDHFVPHKTCQFWTDTVGGESSYMSWTHSQHRSNIFSNFADGLLPWPNILSPLFVLRSASSNAVRTISDGEMARVTNIFRWVLGLQLPACQYIIAIHGAADFEGHSNEIISFQSILGLFLAHANRIPELCRLTQTSPSYRVLAEVKGLIKWRYQKWCNGTNLLSSLCLAGRIQFCPLALLDLSLGNLYQLKSHRQ